jgi:hypothetical protein
MYNILAERYYILGKGVRGLEYSEPAEVQPDPVNNNILLERNDWSIKIRKELAVKYFENHT